jgi:hypothetical protein
MPARRAPVRWNRARRAVAAALAAAFVVLLPAAITSAWIRGTIVTRLFSAAAAAPLASRSPRRAIRRGHRPHHRLEPRSSSCW